MTANFASFFVRLIVVYWLIETRYGIDARVCPNGCKMNLCVIMTMTLLLCDMSFLCSARFFGCTLYVSHGVSMR